GENVQLIRITWPFLVVILVLVSLAIFSIDIMSSVRAYIGGESIWSKGQKDAAFYLNLYAETGYESTYKQYLTAMQGPQNLRTARLALDQVQRQTGGAQVLRALHGRQVLLVSAFVTGFGIQVQVERRIFLALRPDTFTADIRPHRRHDVDTENGERNEDKNDDQKRPGDPYELHILA